jgi:subtilisin family serine protease
MLRKLMLTMALAGLGLGGAPAAVAAQPASIVSAVVSAVVDPHLAAQLMKAGPTDRLLVFVHGRTAHEARTAIAAAGLKLVEPWDRVAVAVVSGTPAQIRAVAADPAVTFVEADRPITFGLDTSHIATRGEDARTLFQTVAKPGTGSRPGKGTGSENPKRGDGAGHGWGHVAPFEPAFADEVVGAGVTVAVVDTGVDGTHPFFERSDGTSKVVRNIKLVCFDEAVAATETKCAQAGGDAVWATPPGNDTDTGSMGGHGTHVAGIVAGVDVTLPDGSKLHGAAPGADLVSLSVGQVVSIYGGTSGLYWILENHADPCGNSSCRPIRVVNNSWGPVGGGNYNPNSATAKIQEQLVVAGVVVVWANGNDGGNGSDNRSNPPAQTATNGVLGVANYDDGDVGSRNRDLDASSSRGKRDDVATYPDLSTPGTNILSSCRPTLAVCGPTTSDWAAISGTSMAAPHVAGIVAQLLQVKPTATPAEIENALEDTAYKFGPTDRYEVDRPERNADDGTSFDAGHGLVDAVGAISRLLGLDPATVPQPPSECQAGTNVVASDDAGDATTTSGVPNPEGNVPALDVVAASILPATTVAGERALAFTIKVLDLSTNPPTGTLGEHFDYEFGYAGNSYFVSATNNRTSVTGPQFQLGRFAPTRQRLATLTGQFNVEADTVTILLPFDVRDDQGEEIPQVPAIVDGSTLTSFTITSRKVMGVLIPNVDSAGGSCPYVVGSGVVNPAPAPEPTPVPPPPAPEPHATLTDGQTFEQDGTSPTDNTDHECRPGDPSCVTYVLKLEPADGTGTPDFALTATNTLEDFDIFIHKWPSNEVVAFSANPATIGEGGSVELTAGTYYVVIQPFSAAQGSAFHVSVSLN